jgi:hypothetical protein
MPVEDLGEPPRAARLRHRLPWTWRCVWQLAAPPGFILFPLILVLVLLDAPSSIALYAFGEPAVATVESDDERTIAYAFVTPKGERIEGTAPRRYLTESALSSTITVTYLPGAPKVHVAGEASVHPAVIMITPLALAAIAMILMGSVRRVREAHQARLGPDLALARDGVAVIGVVTAIEPSTSVTAGYRGRPLHQAGCAEADLGDTRVSFAFREPLAEGDRVTFLHPAGKPEAARPLRDLGEILFSKP